jgi:hypothetical protein
MDSGFLPNWVRKQSCVAALTLVLGTTSALAAPAGPGNLPVHVLGLDAEDADEQADALTAALRERLRQQAGFSLGEPNQPLSSLMAVLKCKGSAPDADCQNKIFAKLGSERIIWGTVKRHTDTVTAELHYTVKGGATVTRSEPYMASLKDPKEARLQEVVTRLLTPLLGLDARKTPSVALAKVTITSGNFQCGVLVDGESKGQLVNGQLVLELPPGQHKFELMKPCARAASTSTLTLASNNDVQIATVLEGTAGSGAGGPPPKDGKSGVSGRTIGGIALLGGGAVAAGVGVYFLTEWGGHSNQASNGKCEAKSPDKPILPTGECQGLSTKMIRESVLGGVLIGVGVVSIGGALYLLFTGPSSDEKAARLRLSPMLGPTSGAVLSGSF